MKKSNSAFTLVELVVTITILTILWTIAFLGLKDYSKDSRNAVRITDIWLIKKSLWVFVLNSWFYPEPNNSEAVSYSGWLLWNQGTFWDTVFTNLSTLSKKPVDPLLNIEYDYSVINNGTKYQLWSITEAPWSSHKNNDVYALDNKQSRSYISWDFDLRDIKIEQNWECFNVTAPSLFVNNLEVGGIVNNWSGYYFVENSSANISEHYSQNIDIVSTGSVFSISEVYNKCSIDSLADLNLYIYNLSKAYRDNLDYRDNLKYEDLIYNSETTAFKIESIFNLKENEIIIDDSIIDAVYDDSIIYTFSDSFTDWDWLLSSHDSDTWWSWTGAIL